jgi:hypothetical protein
LFYLVENVLDGGTVADDTLKIVLQLDFLLQISRFSFQFIFQLLDLCVGVPQVDFRQFTFSDVDMGNNDPALAPGKRDGSHQKPAFYGRRIARILEHEVLNGSAQNRLDPFQRGLGQFVTAISALAADFEVVDTVFDPTKIGIIFAGKPLPAFIDI